MWKKITLGNGGRVGGEGAGAQTLPCLENWEKLNPNSPNHMQEHT